jgi:HAD superfamily hydrolase (TIGR01549 family)
VKRLHPLRAVLLDIDGTLYHQQSLRGLMALELSTLPVTLGSVRGALRVCRILKCFREVREELRTFVDSGVPLANLQYALVAERVCVNPREVKMVVKEWMYCRPLKYLRICRRRGMMKFFQFAAERGLRTGVFSDYPAREKLHGLGIHAPLTVELCATDPELNAFKPNPKGFLHACSLWDLDPGEVLYVGDRPEVDACGAKAAGMPCVIFSRRTSRGLDADAKAGYRSITNFRGLCDVIHSTI